MPVQKTFTIVPSGPGLAGDGITAATRPMTSKQVRKAYKAANKAPSMSRAERLRWERAEQERIRRELDKERAASKARAARERKRAKEEAEREMKKRHRLPLVSVRPSQDTISRFARAKPARGLPTVEEETPGTITEDLPEDAESQQETLCTEDAPDAALLLEPGGLDEGAESQQGTIGSVTGNPPDAEPLQETADRTTEDASGADLLFDGDDFELELLVEAMTAQQTPRSAAASHPHRRFASPTSLDPPPAKPPDPRPPSPTLHPPPPPLSTQAIFSNLDDFFPTSTQLELELEEERGPWAKPTCVPSALPDKCPSDLDDFFPTSTQLELELEEEKRTASARWVRMKRGPSPLPPAPPSSSDKENRAPRTVDKWSRFTASQESYGGDWVDEAALELFI